MKLIAVAYLTLSRWHQEKVANWAFPLAANCCKPSLGSAFRAGSCGGSPQEKPNGLVVQQPSRQVERPRFALLADGLLRSWNEPRLGFLILIEALETVDVLSYFPLWPERLLVHCYSGVLDPDWSLSWCSVLKLSCYFSIKAFQFMTVA